MGQMPQCAAVVGRRPSPHSECAPPQVKYTTVQPQLLWKSLNAVVFAAKPALTLSSLRAPFDFEREKDCKIED